MGAFGSGCCRNTSEKSIFLTAISLQFLSETVQTVLELEKLLCDSSLREYITLPFIRKPSFSTATLQA